MADDVRRLRAELDLLRARYDSGAVPLSVYAVIKQMERDLSWRERENKGDDNG